MPKQQKMVYLIARGKPPRRPLKSRTSTQPPSKPAKEEVVEPKKEPESAPPTPPPAPPTPPVEYGPWSEWHWSEDYQTFWRARKETTSGIYLPLFSLSSSYHHQQRKC